MKAWLEQYWKIALALLVLFGAGQAIGFTFGHRSRPPAPLAPPDSDGARWSGRMLEVLTKQLDLTEEQQQSLGPVLEQAGETVWRERAEALLRMHVTLLQTHDAIAGHLTAGQQQILSRSREDLRMKVEELSRLLAPTPPAQTQPIAPGE